jgi:DGQHR domain-containing protein
MSEKGAQLNARVWSLYEKAGFDTKPNSSSDSEEEVVLAPGKTRPIDLSAQIKKLGVKIIGENKTSPDPGSFTSHVHDFAQLMKAAKADAGLFVWTAKQVSDADRKYAEARKIHIWNEEHLRYYEVLVEAIGSYAKYEMMHSLGISTTEETNIHNVLSLRFEQPYTNSGMSVYMFTIAPEKLLKTCVIYRKAQGSADAYQRMVRKSRLSSVRKFVSTSDALLPPNIIVHLSDQVTWTSVPIPEHDGNGQKITLASKKDYDLGILSIPLEYASLELIDGQHRLYGFVEADAATRAKFNLVVLGLKGVPSEKRRDTFVAINANSSRVDANLVTYLKYTEDEAECQKSNELMAIKIVVSLNSEIVFKNRIKLLDIGNQKITLKGFSGYDLRGLLGPRGLLRKYYPNESKEYIGVLRLYFNVLKSMFPKQWEDADKYIIFTNRGIAAFLKLMKSILNTSQSQLDEATIKKYLKPLRDNWKDTDWETAKLKSAYVGSKGWKDFHRDLVLAIQTVYPDFK